MIQNYHEIVATFYHYLIEELSPAIVLTARRQADLGTLPLVDFDIIRQGN